MKKSLALLLALAMVFALLTACGGTETPQASETPSETPVESAPAEEPSQAPEAETELPPEEAAPQTPALPQRQEVSLPLETGYMEISMYLLIPPFITSMLDSINQLSVLGALEERTGLTFDIVAGNYIDGASVLNVMIASGDYPDIINHIDLYSTGAQAAIEDEVVIDLYDYIVNDMPNLYNALEERNATKQLTTKDGYAAYFPQLFAAPTIDNFAIGMRTDLMAQLGFEAPKTFDQLHEIVSEINKNYGLQYGMNKKGLDQALMTGYNLTSTYRVVDGQTEYCYLTDDMRSYVEMLANWYSEGLILDDFISYEFFSQNEMVSSGLLMGTGNTNPSTINEADVRGEGIELSALDYVTPNEGDEIKVFGEGKVIRSAAWSISTKCEEEKIPVICQLVEYLFSDDGQLLFNYGVEGEGYTLDESGKPQWTDLVINSQSGFVTASFIYATGNPSEYICGVFDDSKFYYNYNQRMFDAMDIINECGTGEYDYPAGADGMMSVDDRTTVSNISGDLTTYIDETVLGWIMGSTPLTDETWQAFIDHCYSMDAQKMIDIYQQAYEDFLVK